MTGTNKPKAVLTSNRPKLKPINREQGLLRAVIVDELVPPDHKARAIWDLTGELDLSGYYGQIRTREGQAGSSAWDPRLLLSVWLYAYSEQVSSAREIARLMEYEPGLMWLSGLGEVNYHTLADFRSQHEAELRKLLAQLLAVMSINGLVRLELVAHDGTKIRAQAGADTFRREPTLQSETRKAEHVMAAIEAAGEDGGQRREAARRRAARERCERMKAAARELQAIREGKRGAEAKQHARVSLSEPEARVMKHGDAGMAPSYNVQLSTDAAHKIVVGVHVTQAASDSGALLPAMDEIQKNFARDARRVVADGGYTHAQTIAQMAERGIDFYGSLSSLQHRQNAAMKAAGIDPAFGPAAFQHDPGQRTLQCPAGKMLRYVRPSSKRGDSYHQFEADTADCRACAMQQRCCGPERAARFISIRLGEKADITAFRAKMETDAAKDIYAKRGPTAEFPNCWIKEKLGIRKFRLRGLAKATIEALWAVLSYNVAQWVRLRGLPAANPAA